MTDGECYGALLVSGSKRPGTQRPSQVVAATGLPAPSQGFFALSELRLAPWMKACVRLLLSSIETQSGIVKHHCL